MKTQDIIILHGWNLSGARFSNLAILLRKKGFRVFTPDFPGFGNEPPPNIPWHVAQYADFLAKYIRIHHINHPILIGHSFGGRVALVYASAYIDSVRKIILTGTPGFSPIPSKKLIAFKIISKIGGMVFSLPGLRAVSDVARRFLYQLAGAKEFLRAEGSMRETFKNVVADDLLPAMQSIHVPCLLVWGELDRIVPVSIATRMKAVISKARLHVIPSVGHGVPFTDPDIFMSSINEFLVS